MSKNLKSDDPRSTEPVVLHDPQDGEIAKIIEAICSLKLESHHLRQVELAVKGMIDGSNPMDALQSAGRLIRFAKTLEIAVESVRRSLKERVYPLKRSS